MYTGLLEHLAEYDILLTTERYGFRSKLTMQNAAYNSAKEILYSINDKSVYSVICRRLFIV
jgi:hypothetical protein